MASRVSVNVNVNDLSRGGLRSVRASLRRLDQQIRQTGGTVTVDIDEPRTRSQVRRVRRLINSLPDTVGVRVDINDDGTRAGARRVRRTIARLPDHVIIRTTLTQPSAGQRNRFTRTLTRSLTSPFRQMGAFLGGTMSDGLGQGIIGAFRAAGPVGMGILAAAILSSLAVVGAALSGLLVTALGLAFVGVGLASAAMSEEVKEQWSHTLGVLKKEFEGVGEPLIPVLDRALERLETMAQKAAPQLKKALAETAPATEAFINSLMDGFESFGKAAFDPIMKAWNVFAPVFGEQWNEFMHELGQAFGDMARLVEEHPTEIAAALEIVFEALTLLVNTVTFFGNVWVAMMQGALDATAGVMTAIANLGIVAVNAMGLMFNGVANVIGLIPGMGDKMDDAKTAFNSWRENAIGNLEGMKTKANEFSGSLDRANKKRKLEADIKTWNVQLEEAKAKLRSVPKSKQAKLKAEISELKRKIAEAKAAIAGVKGKVVWVTVKVDQSAVNQMLRAQEAGRARGGVIGAGMAHGGISRAQTGGVRNNMTLVGEAGPEIVNLAPGSHVRSNPDSRRFMSQQANRTQQVILKLEAGGTDLDRLLLKVLRAAIRDQGGNVQAVLGGI